MAPVPNPEHLYIVEYGSKPQSYITLTNPKTGKMVLRLSPEGPGKTVVHSIAVDDKIVAIVGTRPDAGFTIEMKKSWFSRKERISFRYHGPCVYFEEETKFEWQADGNGYVLVNKHFRFVWGSYVQKGVNCGELRTFIPIESISNHTADYADYLAADKYGDTNACIGEVMRLMVQSMIPIVLDEVEKKLQKELANVKKAEKDKNRFKF